MPVRAYLQRGDGMSVFFTRRGKAAQRVNYVGWIESSGTQWFDTLFKASSENVRIVLDFEYTAAHSQKSLFGSQDGNSNFSVIAYDQPAFYVGTSPNLLALSTALNTRYVLDCHAANGTFSVTFNGATRTASYAGSISKTYSTYLLANNFTGSATQMVSVKLYSCQIYDNGTLVRDFWPCYDPDGVACLYDKVEEKYYYNAGTGEFVAGKTETGDFYWEKYAVGYDAVYTKTSWGQAYDLSVTRYLKKDLSVTMINGSPYWVGASMTVENYPQYPYLLSSTTSNRDTVMYGPLEHTVAAYKDAAKAPYKFTLTGATEAKGEYVATVHATKSDAYPDNGVQDGYWYVKVTQ